MVVHLDIIQTSQSTSSNVVVADTPQNITLTGINGLPPEILGYVFNLFWRIVGYDQPVDVHLVCKFQRLLLNLTLVC
jgi:hypothetical protein